MNNKLCLYKFWSFILLFFSIMLYVLGLYYLSMNYLILMDWEIISINSCSIVMTLLFDWMSLTFIGSVMFISSMVIYYSGSYMDSDVNKLRFLILVLLFVASMCLMIISPNMISILLGWDGLGLISYCLVIYFQNSKSYNAGMLTVLTNRIGDVAILLSIGLLFNNGSWYFMYYNLYCYSWSYLLILLIVIASFTKSAQIPFSSWLPAAMAAPTPVSALVHSSTLVTAGVYLLIRFSEVFYFYDTSLFLLISVLTMFMSGLGANYEYDLKKIIALSTLSQLGLMMSILFMGFPLISFFHLLTHAFFKALLFLCAGLIIHCVNNTQDIRFMGGLINNIPYTSACFCISNLSLCGLPFLSGFYSKDLVLELMSMNYFNLFVYLIFYISVGLTACYSIRLIYYCLINYVGISSFNNYFEDLKMMYSMVFLTFLSIMKGSCLLWLIFPYSNLIILPFECKVLALLFIFLGFYLGYEFSIMQFNDFIFGLNYNYLITFMGSMWFMPSFSTYMLYPNSLLLSMNYIKFLEYGWGEYLISNSLLNYFIFISKLNFYYQNNSIKIYFLLFMLFAFFLFLI
uniref:NADH-ubiquinone oxidoreductase chain 5 n=1 Tax=Metatropis longirostris TaxID=2021940 RepID=A0A343ISE5_9HEMI|nr:NADH dehydrogenase subunit 5 [Metatropis longirostris]AST10170.1 NADH dehydrogenase subunit 5 [Metatropis longirostris]